MPSPEIDFLLFRARRSLGLPGAGPEAPPDWDRCLKLAERHSLMPVLALPEADPLPEAVRRRVRDWTYNWSRTGLSLAAELRRALAALEAAGIPAIPLKGPALAELLYGDVARRTYTDLDLCVRPSDTAAALNALAGAGYRWPGNPARRHLHDRFNWYGEIALRHQRSRVDIDLHWRLAPRHFPVRLDESGFWRRAQPAAFLGRQVIMPAAEDCLLYLCCHGARHAWSSLHWILDVAALALRQPSLDWQRARDLAEPAGATAMLLAGAALARRAFGVPLQVVVPEPVEALAAAIDFDRDPAGGGAEAMFAARLSATRSRGAAYLAAVALIPTEADWGAAGGLPWPLYFPRRLARLAAARVLAW